MFSFLKNHPFAVEAFFESSTVLTFAVLKEELQHLIPECLTLDTFNDKWAFIAMAMVETKSLRPKGFPKIMGNDFFLIGYRVFVYYKDKRGKKRKGLYIIKSETDKKKMEYLGTIFTHYNYTTTDISQIKNEDGIEIKSVLSNFNISINKIKDEVPLPQHSPFSSWKEAKKFSGPLPFTFSYNVNQKKILIIEGVRPYWKPKPIEITDYSISFLNTFQFSTVLLANAFIIENIPYYWKKGTIELWNK